MAPKETAPCGSWKSPITSDLIVSGTVRLTEPSLAGHDVYWIESRPQESGRSVVVRRSTDGSLTDLTPAPFNVRTRVHEYGGGSYHAHDDSLYFANFSDQRLHRLTGAKDPVALSPPCDVRFADFVPDPARSRLIAVCEDHTVDSPYPDNTISALPTGGGSPVVPASGHDFYSNPRLSPDGSRLAFLAWDHPDMPWDSSRLYLADLLPDGSLAKPVIVAGGPSESIFQPEWSPDGVLHFVSDRTGW